MRRTPPLPVRDGLGPARVRLRGGSVLVELASRFGEEAAEKVRSGEVVTADGSADGSVVGIGTILPPGAFVYLYRELREEVPVPFELCSRIVKHRSQLQATEEPGELNAETPIEHLGDGLYQLTPRTGRTHQLRVHMASLGLPIIGDPWYPEVVEVAPDDFSTPLQLLAHRLEFDDPLSGARRVFVSRRSLA